MDKNEELVHRGFVSFSKNHEIRFIVKSCKVKLAFTIKNFMCCFLKICT
eukprot:UN24793